MSTRCNIVFKFNRATVTLYHHSDGNPEYIGADLCRRIKAMGEYDDADSVLTGMLKDANFRYEFSQEGLHGDIEYLYEVRPYKRLVICRAVKMTARGIRIFKETELFNGNKEEK